MPVLLVWIGLQHHEEELSWFSWIQRLVTVRDITASSAVSTGLIMHQIDPYCFFHCSHAWWKVIMLCNSVRTVTARRLAGGFFTKQPKLVLNQKFFTNRQALKNAEIARLPMGLVPRWRQRRSCVQVGPRSWRSCLQVSPRPFVEPPICFRVSHVVTFLVAFKCCLFRCLICWLRGRVLYSSLGRTEELCREMDKLANEDHTHHITAEEISVYRNKWWIRSNFVGSDTMPVRHRPDFKEGCQPCVASRMQRIKLITKIGGKALPRLGGNGKIPGGIPHLSITATMDPALIDRGNLLNGDWAN